MLKKILIALVLLGVLAYGIYYYMSYHYGVKDYTSAAAEFTFKPEALKAEFLADEAAATTKYQDKSISLTGTVTAVQDDMVSFDGADMKFSAPVAGVKVGDQISVKGRFVGYDSLVETIQMDQCSINK